ncbi:MAG TPA: hypothetical protein ENK18_24780 [Deltaproteobacteria bacterium]|nr:hypothetical protein [Deltaproteobacteria bacterium]
METHTVFLYVMSLSGLGVLVTARWELGRRQQVTAQLQGELLERERALQSLRAAHSSLQAQLEHLEARHRRDSSRIAALELELQQTQHPPDVLQHPPDVLQHPPDRSHGHGEHPDPGGPAEAIAPVEELDLLCPADDVTLIP